jgi:hypothetical protein
MLGISFFEHILTFPDEVMHIWARPSLNLTSYLSLSSRYLALVGNLVYVSLMYYGTSLASIGFNSAQ